MPRVTLRQIAQYTDLSTFSVSRALAGKDGVSAETRLLVEKTAMRLGYSKPAPAASRGIGLVFHDLDQVNSELQMQIQAGVQREAQRLKRHVQTLWTHTASEVIDLARASAGLLLVGPYDAATRASSRALGVPVVHLGWVEPLEPVDQVIGTDRESGEAVARYLIELGHECIAFVAGTPGYRGRLERFQGAEAEVARHQQVTLHQLAFDENGGFVPALLSLKQTGLTPTAFFCAHDGLALTVVTELLHLGYRIPEDASVVGFGDFSAATQISPALTTVRLEGVEFGAVAVRLLHERLEAKGEGDHPARRVLITSRLIERRSCGPYTRNNRSRSMGAASGERRAVPGSR
jgi:LacI family transcriptional regulator